MTQGYDTANEQERVILVAVDIDNGANVSASLDELEELAQTAGAITVGRVIQNRDGFHPGTYVGKGKTDEIIELIHETSADTVICDDELSPAQLMNLEDALQIKVIDRTVLILDIFASHASTREGKIQVELAQLRYRSTRLVGMRNSLSRLGGTSSGMGIGSRGPGEKKLEIDRRLIKDRMTILYRELKDVVRAREVLRKQRDRNLTPIVAIVGYTNAGKSTLLNTLTNAQVLEEDMLFATLDPTTRSYEYENGTKILLTDTVGFFNKLPHHLVDAFRSTLEEAKYADFILHVVDVSNPDYELQMKVVYDTLKNLDALDKKVVTAFNKIDCLIGENHIFKDVHTQEAVRISAKQKLNLDHLMDVLKEVAFEGYVVIDKVFPYHEAGKIQLIREYGQLEREDYQEDGIYVKGTIPEELAGLV